MAGTVFEGGCLCGQVRWRANVPPANVRICHCRECQRATSGPFFARAAFLTADFGAGGFERTGEVLSWPTSPRIDRQACARCGTPVFAVPKDPPARLSVPLSTFDDPNAVAPDMHIWVSEKLSWVVIDDGLPQHAKGP